MMVRRKSAVGSEDGAGLVPATGEVSSHHFDDEASPTYAGKLTTARLDGALDNTFAAAGGQPLCGSRPSSRNRSVRNILSETKLLDERSVLENKGVVERALKLN